MLGIQRFHQILYARGQMATFLVLFVALAVLMTMMVLNVGQVALIKTRNNIAASIAGLGIASSVGAIAHTYWLMNGRKIWKCKTDWRMIVGIIIGVVLLIVSWWCAGCLGWAAIVAALATIALTIVQELVILPAIYTKINKKLRGQDLRTRLKEMALFSAFIQAVDDPTKVPDDGCGFDGQCDDEFKDLDEDNDTNELTSRFAVAYGKRLKYLYAPEVPQSRRDQVEHVREDLCDERRVIGQYNCPPDPSGNDQEWDDTNYMSFEEFLTGKVVQPFSPLGVPIGVPSRDEEGTATEFVRWIEAPQPNGHGVDVSFWKEDNEPNVDNNDGDFVHDYQYMHFNSQNRKYCTNIPGDTESGDEDSGPPDDNGALPPGTDEVEWMSCEANEFGDFVQNIRDEHVDDLARTVPEWQTELIKGYWLKEFDFWQDRFNHDWVPALDRAKNAMQCTPTGPCGQWQCTPPPPAWLENSGFCQTTQCSVPDPNDPNAPPQQVTVTTEHPVDCFRRYVRQKFIDPIANWAPSEVTPEILEPPADTNSTPPFYRRFAPIYSWQDKKGRWHHVRVAIADFNLPQLKAKRRWFQSCIVVANHGGQIPIAVTRYDQDQPLTRLWTMIRRSNPDQPQTGTPEDPDAAIAQGVRSCVVSEWTREYPGAFIRSQNCSPIAEPNGNIGEQ